MIGGDRPLMIWPSRSSTATQDSASCSTRRPWSTGKNGQSVCIAGVVQGLAEGLNFAMKAGLEGEALIETLSKARRVPGRWKIDIRRCCRISMNSVLRSTGCEKIWGYALAGQRRTELSYRLLLVDLLSGSSGGGGRWDTSSLLTRYTRRNKPAQFFQLRSSYPVVR